MKRIIYIFIGIVLALLLALFMDSPKKLNQTRKYRGLCMFDIDGTLSTVVTDGQQTDNNMTAQQKNNSAIIKECQDRGFAIMVVTAGPYWTPNTLCKANFTSPNLCKVVNEHNAVNFSNVGSDILMGKYAKSKYDESLALMPPKSNIAGLKKGYAIEQTMKYYGITDPKKVVVFDDLPGFRQGMIDYNNDYIVLDGNYLSPESVSRGLDKVHI